MPLPARLPLRSRRLALWGLLALGTASAGAAERLTLAAALERVEAASPAVLLTQETYAQAVELARRERAGLLPRVNFEAEQRRTQPAGAGGSSRLISDRFDAVLAGSFNVVNPAQIALHRAARQAVTVARLDLEAARQTVYEAVAVAYLAHRRNLRRFDVIRSNIERAEVLLELARRRAEAGVATQIDVTRAEAQLAVAQQDRLQQETVVLQSALLVQRLLGLPPGEPLELEPFVVARRPVGEEVGPVERDRRVDWQRAQEALEQGRLEVRAARYQRLPVLRLLGEWGYGSEEAFDGGERQTWFAAAALTLPVFDGAQIDANRRIAESRLRSAQIRVRDLDDQIGAEWREAWQDARSRLAQVEVAEKQQALAAEELRLARIRYEQGVTDNREVVEAQDNLARAADNVVEAVFRHQLSRLELARVRGDVRGLLAEAE